ncbi:MAG TPA: adenylate cyclase regulatory domain-containing protein [Acidimicrobiales bacterium]|nr:adenylate cyclase regulatory domain-containing protein [Acidimicrobiales bacterium]
MEPDWAAIEAAGLFADAPDRDERRELLAWLVSQGFTFDELVSAHARGDLIRAAGERHIRPGARAMTLAQLADRLDCDVAVVRRIWRSLGAVDPGPDVLVASEDDLDMVRIALSWAEIFGEDTVFALVRRIGALLERASEAMSAAAIGAAPDISTLVSGSEVVTAKAYEAIASLVPDIGRMLDLAFRHHIEGVRVLFEESGAGADGRPWLTLGVGFADLSGYTSTSLTLDLDELAALVGAFEARAAEVVAEHGGRVVKFVGDAALFVSSDPDALAEMATALVQTATGTTTLPARVGLTYGTVVARDGDFFGPAVNLAARLVDVAQQQSVVIDEGLRAALDPARWSSTALAPQSLRGIPEPVPVFGLRPA